MLSLAAYWTATKLPLKWLDKMRRLVALKILIHDRSTTAGAVLGVVAIIFLVGQQLSLLFGLITYMSVLVDHSGADIWILSKNTQTADASATLPVRYIDRIYGLPDVEWVEPIISGGGLFRNKEGRTSSVLVVGVRRPRLAGGPWDFVEGSSRVLLDYDGVTVDNLDLEVLGNPEMQGIFEINGTRIRIVGITKGARGFAGTLLFTNMQKARQISQIPPGRCSNILIKLKHGSELTIALSKLKMLLPQADVISSTELSRKTREYYLFNTGIGGSFGFSTVIGLLIGIVIISLTMYTSVLNRKKDFAVMRALGGRKRDILIIVIFQSLFIAMLGIFIGFLFLSLLFNAIRDSNIPFYMFLWVPPIHAAITFAICVIVSLISMRGALKIEPASAFR
jgi:putative ABC transport system permease protein